MKEAIEEEAQKRYPINYSLGVFDRAGLNSVAHTGFVEGAQWQAEKMLTKTQAIYFAGYLMGKKMQDPKADVSDIFDEWEKNLKPICKE